MTTKKGQGNSKIPKGQTEIVKSEDRQDDGHQNERKDKHRTHNTTLKTKPGVTRTLQNQGEFRCSGKVYILQYHYSIPIFMLKMYLDIQDFAMYVNAINLIFIGACSFSGFLGALVVFSVVCLVCLVG